MDRFTREQLLGAGPQPVRIAIVLLKPLLEHFVDRGALPSGRMIRVDRVDRAQLQDGLRIISERIRFEPVHGGDRDAVGPLFCRQRRRGPVDRARRRQDHRARASAARASCRVASRRVIASRRSRKREATVGERLSRRARVISTSGAPSALAKSCAGKTDPAVEGRHAQASRGPSAEATDRAPAAPATRLRSGRRE